MELKSFNIIDRKGRERTVQVANEPRMIQNAILNVSSPRFVSLDIAHPLVAGKHTKKTNPFNGFKVYAYRGLIGIDYASAMRNLLAAISKSPSLEVQHGDRIADQAKTWEATENKWGKHLDGKPHILEQHGKLYVQLLDFNAPNRKAGALFRAFTDSNGDQVALDKIRPHLLASQLKSSSSKSKMNADGEERWEIHPDFITRRITLANVVNARGLGQAANFSQLLAA